MVTARSTPNIGLIKYWGNRNNELRLPMANSSSITLDSPSVEVTIDHSDKFSLQSFNPDGSIMELTEKNVERFQKHLELIKRYLKQLGATNAIPSSISTTIHSAIPLGIGLASSSAVFSALARAYQGIISGEKELTDEQVSVIARLGAGSAARGLFGGFGTLLAGEGDDIDSAVGSQIADENHWPLFNIVLAPSLQEKKVGSTEGHATPHTSPHYPARIQAIQNRRMQTFTESIMQKDFEKLQNVCEEDCMDMHHVMETSDPPLHYLNEVTHRIIADITSLRTSQHIPVLYTMDAGPTVHLVCTEEARDRVADFAHAQADCTVFETTVGKGAHLV